VLPLRHVAFIHELKPAHVEGDYFFVHAGIRPGVPLEDQAEADMLWIGEEFLVATETTARPSSTATASSRVRT